MNYTRKLPARFVVFLSLLFTLLGCSQLEPETLNPSSTVAGVSITNVAASSDDGNVPENTLDGNLRTRWSAKDDGEWIAFDLAETSEVEAVAIAWYRGNVRTADFTIQVSDGRTWTNVFEGTSSGDTLELQTYTFRPVQARRVRIVGYGNSENNWNSLTEVRLLESGGLWISANELRQLPTSGPAWDHLKRVADRNAGQPDLGDLTNKHHVNVLSQAFVAARLDSDDYRRAVRDELRRVRESDTTNRRTVLGPARKMASYVIAADLIDLTSFDPRADEDFRSWISALRWRVNISPRDPDLSLVQAHEVRPNNFGTAAGAARIAIDIYLGDDADLERAATVFRGYLGDRRAYDDFEYGRLDWQAESTRPVGINPKGALVEIDGRARSVDGVLPEEQRRQSGVISWPPKRERYAYAGLQGAVVQAELLSRQGYDAWSWSDEALRRAADWLHQPHFEGGGPYLATGTDAEWIMPLLNARYNRDYPWSPGLWRGDVLGYTDWTHGSGDDTRR